MSLAPLSDQSQIQASGVNDAIWNTFRRGVWIDRDLDELMHNAGALNACERETAALLKVIGAMLDRSRPL